MNPTDVARLIRAIAPADFPDGLPLYVVDGSELPDDLQGSSEETFGFAGQRLDIALRAWLNTVGRWEGRGPAVVVFPDHVRHSLEMKAGDDDELYESLFRQRMIGLTCHECAHTLDFGIDLEPVTEAAEELQRAFTAEWCQISSDVPMSAPWVGHTARWLRLALHLAHRAERHLGERIPLSLVCNSSRYEISSPWCYAGALGDEPARCSGLPLADIAKQQPPTGFVELWKADVRRWRDGQVEDANKQITLATEKAARYELAFESTDQHF